MKIKRKFAHQLFPVIAALALAGTAQAADFTFTPGITVNEEFTDNIAEDKDKTLGSEFITRAMPGITARYMAPFWTWDLNYKYEYRYYAREKFDNEDLHHLAARSRLNLIDEVMFVDISDTYERVSLDQSRDRTLESLRSDQSDQNNFTVAPGLVLRPTERLILRPGASYQNIWYKDPGAVDRNIYNGIMGLSYQFTEKFSLIANYLFSYTDAEGNLSRTHNAMGGIQYEYAKDSFVSIQGGNSWLNTSDGVYSNPIWNVAINYAGSRFNLRASTGEKYDNDPSSNKVTLNTSHDVGVDYLFEKGKFGFTSGIMRLEEMPDNRVKSVSYKNSADLSYQVFTDWETRVSYAYNYVDIRESDTYTTISTFNAGLSRLYSRDARVSLNYRNLHMYSPDIEVDNKDINNVILEVSKTF